MLATQLALLIDGAYAAMLVRKDPSVGQAAIAAAPKLLKTWAANKFAKCEEAYRLRRLLQEPDEVYYKDLGLTPAQVIKLMDFYHEVKFTN